MPDLWKALGDVYGDTDPDGPPVTPEPAAADRVPEATAPVTATAAASTPAAPTPASPASTPLDDDLAAYLSAALVNAPASRAPAKPAEPELPPPGEAQAKVAEWIADIEHREEVRAKGPDLEAVVPPGSWARTDDDILPAAKKGRARRK